MSVDYSTLKMEGATHFQVRRTFLSTISTLLWVLVSLGHAFWRRHLMAPKPNIPIINNAAVVGSGEGTGSN
jgi:hypothetical protein